MKEFETKIKGRPHRGYYFIVVPLVYVRPIKINHKEAVKVTIIKDKNTISFITTINFCTRNGKVKRAIVHINKYVRKILDLKFKDKVIVKVEKPKFIEERSKEIFKDNKIDFLALVPKDIFVVENNGNLVLWRPPRTRSIEIKRFIDTEKSAKFFGLLFSEGQKCENTTGAYISITNKEIEPHITVVSFLKELFGHSKIIRAYCYYDPNSNNLILEDVVKDYEKRIGILPKPVKAERQGNYTFTTNVNSTLIGETALNGLNILCNILVNQEFDEKLKQFAKKFIAEEIAGDGYLNVSSSGVSVRIGDENEKRRKVIEIVLNKLGLETHEDSKLLVHCDITSATKRFKLLNLGILKEKNKIKLIKSFTNLKFLNLQMQRLKKLLNVNKFDNKRIREIFGWSSNKTTKWLSSMLKREFTTRIKRDGHSVFYTINKTNSTIQQYLKWEKEYKTFFKN